MKTTAIRKSTSIYRQMSIKPEPLIITSLMARMNHLAGKMFANHWKNNGMLFSGKRKPDSSTVGRNSPIIVIIMASNCEVLTEEINIPNDAAVIMKMTQRNNRKGILPLIGILNTKTLITNMIMVLKKEIIM